MMGLLTVKRADPLAGEAGLCPAGAEPDARHDDHRNEGAHGGTMGSPMLKYQSLDYFTID